MDTMSAAPITERERLLQNRWLILVCSIVSMVAVANLQYGWTLFVEPLANRLGAEVSLVQVAFTVFVLLETWLVPFEGYLVDRFGPRNLVLAGSALTVAPIADLIKSAGYQTAFIQWGIIQGVVVVIAALFLKAPPAGWLPHGWTGVQQEVQTARRQSARDFTPAEMSATPQFWLMYFMMTMVATGGLMATAQLAPMAADYKVDQTVVTFLWITLPALTFALQADRIINGLCRPFWGWISDHIGRERTMAIAFSLEAVAIFCLISFAHDPLLFVFFTA